MKVEWSAPPEATKWLIIGLLVALGLSHEQILEVITGE